MQSRYHQSKLRLQRRGLAPSNLTWPRITVPAEIESAYVAAGRILGDRDTEESHTLPARWNLA
jgi:hypothetical protein